MDDFSLDLLKIGVNSKYQEYFSPISSYGYSPSIPRPTIATRTSFTIIDNIWHSSSDVSIRGGIILSDITDHYPVFLRLQLHTDFRLSQSHLASYKCRSKMRDAF